MSRLSYTAITSPEKMSTRAEFELTTPVRQRPRHTGRETVTRRDFQFLKANKMTLEMNIWRFCMH